MTSHPESLKAIGYWKKTKQNKTKYLTWNLIRLMFVKKTSMWNCQKPYIMCYSSIIPRTMKSLSNFIRKNCQKICSWSSRPEPKMEIRKMVKFFINKFFLYKFFNDVTKHRKKTNRVVDFSCRPFPNILNYRNHRWDLLAIWKTRYLETYWRVQLVRTGLYKFTPTPPIFQAKTFTSAPDWAYK